MVEDAQLTPLPWQSASSAYLQELLAAGRLPHALLLHGQEGIGKLHLAHLFAQVLLCHHPLSTAEGILPCGGCDACLLIRAGNHPDLRLCTPVIDARSEKEKDSISVDQVRELTGFMMLKPHYGRRKIAIINPADKLNINASNALLKTLEEPPEDSLLILVSSRPSRLPATVLSRCQRLRCIADNGSKTAAWLSAQLPAGSDAALLLALSAGSPLAALSLAQEEGAVARRQSLLDDIQRLLIGKANPLEMAENWLKFGVKESLYLLYTWLADMARLSAAQEPPRLSNPDREDALRALTLTVDAPRLHRELDKVAVALRLAEGQVNAQLLLEEVLISCAARTERKSSTIR
jgi:DNA polymerase-3 subunit delta'